MGFPLHGEEPTEDATGAWTVSGFHNPLPEKEWEQIKARKRYHLIMRVSDDPADDPPRFHHDPVAVFQEVLGLLIVVPVLLAFLAVLSGICYLWATY